MAVTVSVTGFPTIALKNKIIMKLRQMFRSYGINQFWVRDLTEIKSGGKIVQAIKIDFNDGVDAEKAAHRLNGADFEYQGQLYYLAAHLNEGPDRSVRSRRNRPLRRNQQRTERESGHYERSRHRSRSPIDDYGLSGRSNVDIEIELLRKQREIIEEERRLLLERKKLDLIREYGPSASKELALFDDRERDYRKRDREDRYRRPSPVSRKPNRPQSRPVRRSPPPQQSSIMLPTFFLPCARLLKEMKPLMKGLSQNTIKVLIQLLKSTLRRRIAVMLDGKPHVNAATIIDMYRKLYNPKSDEDLVKTHLNKMGVSPKEQHERNARRNIKDEDKNKELEPSSPLLTAGDQEDLVKDHGMSPDDKDTEIRNEIAISLDATEIEESLDWTEGGTDWN